MRRVVYGKKVQCPFRCLYCFTLMDGYESTSQINQDEFIDAEIIQPCCDYDLFTQSNWEEYLMNLTSHNKIISLATKKALSRDDISKLAGINERLLKNNAFFHLGVTVTKINDWQIYEPYASSPGDRMNMLRLLKHHCIPTTLTIRPILPTLASNEVDIIVNETKDFCNNYIIGNLYVSKRLRTFLEKKAIDFRTKPQLVEWISNKPVWDCYVNEDMQNYITKTAEKCGKKVFQNNIDAVEDIRLDLDYEEQVI